MDLPLPLYVAIVETGSFLLTFVFFWGLHWLRNPHDVVSSV
ncbi:MAG TPA: hypothetical protein VHW24_25760 [Bryobacteraceae bacterium]|nr:hypothetical protein [Bryobacteraceae bacterium]